MHIIVISEILSHCMAWPVQRAHQGTQLATIYSYVTVSAVLQSYWTSLTAKSPKIFLYKYSAIKLDELPWVKSNPFSVITNKCMHSPHMYEQSWSIG